jgi:two-component system chemotaxis sensor kinase CheA
VSDLRQRLLATFQEEHREHVEQIRALLAQVAQDPAPRPALEEAFRRAHSLKGAARAVDLRGIETLAHRLETLFSRLREGLTPLEEGVLDTARQALDASEDLLAGGGHPGRALAALDRLLGMETPAETAAEPAVAALPASETLRLSTEKLDRLMRSVAELTAEIYAYERLPQRLAGLADDLHSLQSGWRRRPDPEAVERRLRELVRQARGVYRTGQQAGFGLHLRARRLQQDAWLARMTTPAALWEGFRKMMRDLARDEGKEIDFRTEGFETQADRTVLEALKDPVMHLLRNAASHGIERPGERQARGKPPTGRVTLSVAARGARLEVRVEDDGRGLDPPAILAAALRRGLLPSAEAEALAPERLARLVFLPGLSTSRVVTELAGRGMGLSVVAERLRGLQGEADVQAGPSGGAAFVLLAPLTVATHRLLLVTCAGHTFGLPLRAVRRVCRLRPERIETVEGRPTARLDHGAVPVASLARLVGLPEPATAGTHVPAVVLRSVDGEAALVVDALVEEREAVIQELGLTAQQSGGALGAIVLENGTAPVVLDPAALWEAFRRLGPAPLAAPAAPAPERRAPTVLIVDDSVTTRSLEKSILEAHGYQVRLAVDGVEALHQLRLELPAAVIADIQMPRLDGFGLLEEMKKDARLAALPVILVTSLERREDQQRGLALGADAYIVKRKFDQHELLDTLRQVVI